MVCCAVQNMRSLAIVGTAWPLLVCITLSPLSVSCRPGQIRLAHLSDVKETGHVAPVTSSGLEDPCGCVCCWSVLSDISRLEQHQRFPIQHQLHGAFSLRASDALRFTLNWSWSLRSSTTAVSLPFFEDACVSSRTRTRGIFSAPCSTTGGLQSRVFPCLQHAFELLCCLVGGCSAEVHTSIK